MKKLNARYAATVTMPATQNPHTIARGTIANRHRPGGRMGSRNSSRTAIPGVGAAFAAAPAASPAAARREANPPVTLTNLRRAGLLVEVRDESRHYTGR